MRTFIDFKLLLIVFVSFIFVTCDSEDVVDDIPNEATNENITGAPFGKYQQLNMEEALGFVNEIKPEKPSNEGDGLGTLNASSDFLVGVDANSLAFEDVENTAHKIPTLKAHLKSPEIESTAFLIKVEDSVLGFLMNSKADKTITGEYFSGIIGITDLSGNFVNGYRLKNGEFVSQFVVSKSQKSKDSVTTTKSSSSFSSRFMQANDPPWRGIALDEVVVTAPRKSGGGVRSSLFFMRYRNFTTPRFSGGSVGGGFAGGKGGGGAVSKGKVFPCDNPVGGCSDNVDVKIINELTGKAKCVYDKLEELSGGFKNMIQKFDGDFPVAHLKFSMTNDLADGTNAVTSNSGQKFIEIKINANTLGKRTIVGLSRTFAHEVIHAELYRKIRSVGGKVSINDFPGIYDYYRRYVKNWQHEQMAAHYTNIIANIISDFDNNRHSYQFYKDIAWEGLHETTSWESLSNAEKSRVLKNIKNLKSNGNKTCK